MMILQSRILGYYVNTTTQMTATCSCSIAYKQDLEKKLLHLNNLIIFFIFMLQPAYIVGNIFLTSFLPKTNKQLLNF